VGQEQSECARSTLCGYFVIFYRLLVDFSNVCVIRSFFFLPPRHSKRTTSSYTERPSSHYVRVLRLRLLKVYKNPRKFFDGLKNAVLANGGLWHQRSYFDYARLKAKRGEVILDYFVLLSRHGGQKKQILFRFGDVPSIFELGTLGIKLDTRPMSWCSRKQSCVSYFCCVTILGFIILFFPIIFSWNVCVCICELTLRLPD